jgi:hypothetical protein
MHAPSAIKNLLFNLIETMDPFLLTDFVDQTSLAVCMTNSRWSIIARRQFSQLLKDKTVGLRASHCPRLNPCVFTPKNIFAANGDW